ncbi:hypothetical protein BTN49_0638 [Candidatus Enterovibrio escicola]|uniref:Uncharacterized protein n=1 Tax=Candidatus Enterovibrio escicola TaxID=1927127 RepID=A0A2A5T634_9GAMM|nr:hypothetical protein BTN49_0638 [Candidatus Enterovibrio escacola]
MAIEFSARQYVIRTLRINYPDGLYATLTRVVKIKSQAKATEG